MLAQKDACRHLELQSQMHFIYQFYFLSDM